MKRGKFLQNAVWLTATSLLLRCVGMFYRIFIAAKIGEAGMGLYQMILSVYMLATAFATAGMSIAVTRLVSESEAVGEERYIRHVMTVSLRWSMGLGLASAVTLAAFAPLIAAKALGQPTAVHALYILCLSLPFMAGTHCYYGFFIAKGNAAVNCLAQLAEQAARIALVACIIDRFVSGGRGTEAVLWGNTVSEIVSFLVMTLWYSLSVRRNETAKPHYGVSGRLFSISLPIAAGRYLSTGLRTIENLLVPTQIALFTASRETALSQFGALKGMALPLLMFPSAFLHTIATLLIPEITAAKAAGDRDKVSRLCRRSLQTCFVLSIMIGGLFYRFAEGLGEVLYHSDMVSFMLKVLAPVLPFMYLDCICDGMLKGMGEQVASLRYNTLDSVVRILLSLLLLSRFGIGGFLTVMVISNLSVSLLHFRRLTKVCAVRPPWISWVVRPLCCALFAQWSSSLFFSPTGAVGLILGSLAYAALFLLALILTGGIRPPQKTVASKDGVYYNKRKKERKTV